MSHSNLVTTAWSSNGRDVVKIEGPLDPKQLKDLEMKPYRGFSKLRLERYWFSVPGTTMHINTWENICADLGVDPDDEGNYPEYLAISAIVYAEGSRNDEF